MAKTLKNTAPKAQDKAAPVPRIAFRTPNYLIFLAAVIDIVFGFFLLSKDMLTAAPLVLVFGFCVLLPLAPLWGIWNDSKLE